MMSGEWVFIVNQNLELALLSLAKKYLKLSIVLDASELGI